MALLAVLVASTVEGTLKDLEMKMYSIAYTSPPFS